MHQHFIFGGTFNPIHHGHLETAKAIHAHFLPKTFAFMPAQTPVHKKTNLSIEHRLNMLKRVIRPPFSIDTWEVEQKRACFAIETLQNMRKRYPEDALIWIIGSDQDLTTWYHWQDLFHYGHFIRVIRQQNPDPIASALIPYQTQDEQDLKTKKGGCLYTFQCPPYPISSTEIRRAIQEGKIPKDLSPEVYRYIQDHRLYLS